MVKSKLEQRIIDALEAEAPARGIDVVDVEVVGATKAPCVRVRLDLLDGTPIGLDAVTAQSPWVGDCVERIDPFKGSYTLEVSSPGMKRPLRRPSDFERFMGSEVECSCVAGIEGRRSFKGSIAATTDAEVTLALVDGTTAVIPFDDIKKCTLKPVYDFKGITEEED